MGFNTHKIGSKKWIEKNIMSLTIEDKASGFLRQLGIVAPSYINEGLSKGAFLVYKNIQSQASRYTRDNFTQYHQSGQRGIIGRGQLQGRGLRRKAVLTGFGKPFDRYSRSSPNTRADGAKSMADLTRWKLYDSKMKAVVGWMNTKAYTPTKYKDGAAVGIMPRVKGVRLYDPMDTTKKHNIGELLELGGTIPLSKAQKSFFKASGMARVARRGYVIRKARPLVAPAFSASRGSAEQKMMDTVAKIVDFKATNTAQRRAS